MLSCPVLLLSGEVKPLLLHTAPIRLRWCYRHYRHRFLVRQLIGFWKPVSDEYEHLFTSSERPSIRCWLRLRAGRYPGSLPPLARYCRRVAFFTVTVLRVSALRLLRSKADVPRRFPRRRSLNQHRISKYCGGRIRTCNTVGVRSFPHAIRFQARCRLHCRLRRICPALQNRLRVTTRLGVAYPILRRATFISPAFSATCFLRWNARPVSLAVGPANFKEPFPPWGAAADQFYGDWPPVLVDTSRCDRFARGPQGGKSNPFNPFPELPRMEGFADPSNSVG